MDRKDALIDIATIILMTILFICGANPPEIKYVDVMVFIIAIIVTLIRYK